MIDWPKIFREMNQKYPKVEEKTYKLVCHDEQGFEFKYDVTVKMSKEYGHVCIYFGCECWDYSDIKKHYPYSKEGGFVIDMCGLNHMGSKVSVPGEEMNKIIEFFGEVK